MYRNPLAEYLGRCETGQSILRSCCKKGGSVIWKKICSKETRSKGSGNFLADFLRKNRAEVVSVSIFEYDEEFHMEVIREEERKEGIAIGIKQGLEQGEKRANQNAALRMIRQGELSLEKIAGYVGLSVEEVGKLAAEEKLQMQI